MDISGIVGTVLSRVTEAVLDRVMKGIPIEEKGVVLAQRADRSAALQHHLGMISQWAAEISFRDLVKSKRFQESFVDLDLHLGVHRASKRHKFKVSDITALPSHFVILGDPGSGKTTSLKRIASGILHDSSPAREPEIPLLVQLRDLSGGESLNTRIAGLLGFSVTYDEAFLAEHDSRYKKRLLPRSEKGRINLPARNPSDDPVDQEELAPIAPILQRIVSQSLDALHCVLLVDGLDELRPSAREPIVAELRYLLLHVAKGRIIITSRTADFGYHLENATATILQPLSPSQIEEFALRWLGSEDASDFVGKVNAAPYSGSEIRPLTLAHLCAIYERVGTVPEKPRTVYRKIVHLLLEEWDQQRSIRRYSRYAGFEVDRKEEFLQALAYQITFTYRTTRFTDAHLNEVYLRIHKRFGLPATEAKEVVREIESHTGLVMEVAHDTYEFAHKSIQEYLTASYLVKLPDLSRSLHNAPNEAALIIALSSNANEHFYAILRHGASWPMSELSSFSEIFLSRLVLEHVDFVVADKLGVYTLWLYWRKYHSTDHRQGNVKHLPQKDAQARKKFFLDFLKLPAVLESTSAVLKKCEIERRGASGWHVTLPAHYSLLSPTERLESMYIDDALLEAVNL
ncbi:MAG TPA: NACHT domain-containing protein [Longimicrobium sp.]